MTGVDDKGVAIMDFDGSTHVMEPTFEQWTALTDAYAKQLSALQMGDPQARAEAIRLAREVQRIGMPVHGGSVEPPV